MYVSFRKTMCKSPLLSYNHLKEITFFIHWYFGFDSRSRFGMIISHSWKKTSNIFSRYFSTANSYCNMILNMQQKCTYSAKIWIEYDNNWLKPKKKNKLELPINIFLKNYLPIYFIFYFFRSLSSNQLSSLPRGLIDEPTKLATLNLDDNPWVSLDIHLY